MSVRLSIFLAAAAAVATPAFGSPAVQLAQAAPAKPVAAQSVTRAAVIKDLDTTFKAVDTNHDGVLDKNEMAAAQTAALQQRTTREQQRAAAEFTKLDTNKDGQLSKAEFLAALQPVRARETPDQMVAQLDANKDGKVSVEEYRAPRLAGFDKLDANHDGTLSQQEAQAVRRAPARKK